jgi:translation initiation factor IF-2
MYSFSTSLSGTSSCDIWEGAEIGPPFPFSMGLAEKDKVDIKTYRIIYEALDEIQAAMNGMLEPEYKEVVQGRAEVRATFKVSSVGTIAGCYVLDGKINRNNDVRVVRNGIVIYEGKLASLKRFKDDVKEVSSGYECGLNVEKFNDIKEGDIIEAFANEQINKNEANK